MVIPLPLRRAVLIGALVCTLGLVGCDAFEGGEPLPGYGLPIVELTLDTEARNWLQANVHGARYVKAGLRYDGKGYRVEVRHQGGVSRTSWKKNFRVQLLDGALPGALPGGLSEVIFSAQYSDPSMLRSMLGFDVFARAGFLVPEMRWVALYLDGAYHGLYLMIETVDPAFLRRRGRREGSLYRAELNADLTFRDGPYALRDGLDKQWGEEGSYADLEHLVRILDTAPAADLPVRLEPILDVRGYLDYIAVSVVIDHRDGFFKNYLLYRDPDDGRFIVLPWDLDATFTTPAVWFPYGLNRLSERLMEVPAYRAYYLDRVRDVGTRLLSQDRLAETVRRHQARIAEAYAHDPYFRARGYRLDDLADEILSVMARRRAPLDDLIQNPSVTENY